MYSEYKINEKYIHQALATFYGLIDEKKEGDPNTRYKSWEYCYQIFQEKRTEYQAAEKKKKEEIVDFLALHLAFYLASWGMYRGSSFLLQRDYKTHKPAVEILLEAQYDCLCGYCPEEPLNNATEQNKLLFGEEGLYERIRESYNKGKGESVSLEDGKNVDTNASDTLITKILMGALGCVPAFDRFLKRGIKWLKEISGYTKITQSIEDKGKTFALLEKFAFANKDALRIKGNTFYPIMKCVDMFLWQIGYEYDVIDVLGNEKASQETKNKAVKRAQILGIAKENDYKSVSTAITERWEK